MSEGGDRGFLFRSAGLGLLALALWQLGEAGGILAAREQLLANREAMVRLGPLFLLGLFFLRGPLPSRKSVARVAGFQFLNLGFLVGGAIYGLAAVPLGVEFPANGAEEVGVEPTWPIRDRIQMVEERMAQLDRESVQAAELSQGATDSKRKEVENKKQERLRQMEDCRIERGRLGNELEKRVQVIEAQRGKEKGAMEARLERGATRLGGGGTPFYFARIPRVVGGLYRGWWIGAGRVSCSFHQRGQSGKFGTRRASAEAQCFVKRGYAPLGETTDLISGRVKAVLCPGWPGAAASSR